jgi:hypothetical protein
MPKTGHALLRAVAEAEEERARAYAQSEAERAALVADGLITEDAEAEHELPTAEAFEGTSIFTPAKGIVVGWHGRGKSAVALELAHSFASGAPLFGLFPCNFEPGEVLMIQTENAQAEMERRMHALRDRDGFDAALPNLLVMRQSAATKIDLSMPVHRERIEKHGIRYLFLDPLYELVGGLDMSNRDMQVPSLMRYLATLQADCGVDVWFTHRGNGAKMSEGIMDSTYLRHHAECVVGVERKDVTGNLYSDFTIYVEPKRYRADYTKQKIALRGKGIGVWEPKAPAASKEAVEAGEPTREELLDMVRVSVKEKPDLTVRARAEELGISKSMMGRRLAALRAEEEH